MDLTDRIGRKIVDVLVSVVNHVVRANNDVADVAQQLTACTPHDLREKIGLFHRGRTETHITGWVLDQIRLPQCILNVTYVC